MDVLCDPTSVLIDWKDNSAFTVADAQAGVLVLGATGAGKSSGPARLLAHAYLRAGWGGLVLCAKVEEAQMWRNYARETGRSDDLVVIDAQGGERFNFLEWQAARGEEGAGFAVNVVALLDEIAAAVEGGGEGEGGDNVFFRSSLRHLLTNLVDLCMLAGYRVSMPLMRLVANSAPLNMAELENLEWQQRSTCWRLLTEAGQATADNPAARADFDECSAYFTQEFPALSDRTRSIIQLMFSMLVRPFVTRPLRGIFSEDTTIKPDDTFMGKIIVLDLPSQEFRLAGRMAAMTFKWCWQLAVMRRKRGKEPLRPCFLWSDECQNFLTESDAEFQAVARSGAGCSVYLTQQRESIRRAVKSDDATENLLANLTTKFFCANTGATNAWASELIGERWTNITTTNIGRTGAASGSPMAEANASAGVSRKDEQRRYVEPNRFTTLKRGGPLNAFRVEAIVYAAGKLFGPQSEEPMPYKVLAFRQSER